MQFTDYHSIFYIYSPSECLQAKQFSVKINFSSEKKVNLSKVSQKPNIKLSYSLTFDWHSNIDYTWESQYTFFYKCYCFFQYTVDRNWQKIYGRHEIFFSSKPVSVFVNYLKFGYKKELDELLCQKVVLQPSIVNTFFWLPVANKASPVHVRRV